MSQTNHAEYIEKTLKGSVKESYHKYNNEVIVIDEAQLHDVVKIIRDELDFEILLDVVAIDWLKWKVQPAKEHRFEIDYFFYSLQNKQRIHLKVPIKDEVNPQIDSVADLYYSADWAERECWDMMGVKFKGHPNLQRILMWDEFEGHALRKDYRIDKRQPIPVVKDLL